MTINKIFFYPLYAAALALATFLAPLASAEEKAIVPLSPSLEQVSLYLDWSSSDLDFFLELVQEGDWTAALAALGSYTQELSRFHVALGRLRMGKAERKFVLSVLERLQRHRIRLQSVSEKGPPDWKVVAKEAEDHLESALRMAEQKVERRGWASLKRYGTDRASSEQEKLKAARAAASLDASQLDGLKRNGRSQ